MTVPPIVPAGDRTRQQHIFGRTKLVIFLVLTGLLIFCAAAFWTTRDAMEHLPFLKGQAGAQGRVNGKKPLVDLSPWQTAQSLAPLAVTAEEMEYARDAERLADHEVDQAFASALRQANLQAQHRALTGDALALAQKVAQLEGLEKEDQAQVKRLTARANSPSGTAKQGEQPAAGNDDLEVAKAQLGLDSDELADARRDLERASGDTSVQIQAELAAHEASMKAYDSESHGGGQIAVLSEKQHRTLVGLLKAWFGQNSRYQLLQQALQQTQKDARTLTAEHNALEASANAAAASSAVATDAATELTDIKDRSAKRQILSIYDDRIQADQQLAIVYDKWSAQVLLQHRIVFHLMLQLVVLIVFIAVCMMLCDAFIRRFIAHPALVDRRQMHTLRSVLELATQAIGMVLILLIVFGFPQQISTLLGLATAGLTIALQDFILAFFGWFVLMGKNGIRVGDWVEINGVSGETVEIGLIHTTLLETGNLVDRCHPTGRRGTFNNSFAIRGQYFNFSTAGQWMWDEITVNISESENATAMVERIQKMVLEETEDDARIAEEEWKKGQRGDGVSRFSATPVVNLRPSSSGFDVQVHYVTRAPGRFDVHNRLCQRVVELLHENTGTGRDLEDKKESAPVAS
jgi:small-conductance mechanosensitive channel